MLNPHSDVSSRSRSGARRCGAAADPLAVGARRKSAPASRRWPESGGWGSGRRRVAGQINGGWVPLMTEGWAFDRRKRAFIRLTLISRPPAFPPLLPWPFDDFMQIRMVPQQRRGHRLNQPTQSGIGIAGAQRRDQARRHNDVANGAEPNDKDVPGCLDVLQNSYRPWSSSVGQYRFRKQEARTEFSG